MANERDWGKYHVRHAASVAGPEVANALADAAESIAATWERMEDRSPEWAAEMRLLAADMDNHVAPRSGEYYERHKANARQAEEERVAYRYLVGALEGLTEQPGGLSKQRVRDALKAAAEFGVSYVAEREARSS